MLYIHPDEWRGLWAHARAVCPVEAIFYEDDVPDQWKDFYKANVEFFSDLGSPGGASKVGKINKDHAHRGGAAPRRETRADPRRTAATFSRGICSLRTARRPGRIPDGIVDLSVGTPVDPVPEVVQDALRAAADAPGYPRHPTAPSRWREAAAGWLGRGHGVTIDPDAVLPLIGTKEFIASPAGPARLRARRLGGLPGAGLPDLRHRGAAWQAPGRWPPTASPPWGPQNRPGWCGVNSPSNPTGRVLPPGPPGQDGALGAAESGARVLASDECYIGLGWDAEPVSVLHPRRLRRVVRRPARGCTRCPSGPTWPATGQGFVTGDPALIAQLLEIRKHAGMMMPTPGPRRR